MNKLLTKYTDNVNSFVKTNGALCDSGKNVKLWTVVRMMLIEIIAFWFAEWRTWLVGLTAKDIKNQSINLLSTKYILQQVF